MQKLSEILILRQILRLKWPQAPLFQHEPQGKQGGKRPELLAVLQDETFVFEVKTPALLEHQRKRSTNGVQAPSRVLPKEALARLAEGRGITFPRDNVVKDFLLSANEKFAAFSEECHRVLIIVWDDFIFEPITSLVHDQCGLLTPKSFFRDEKGDSYIFSHIDAVILIRHLVYFKHAAGDQPLLERSEAFDFGDENSLPNVYIPIPGSRGLPAFVCDGLRALPLSHPFLCTAAEYRPQELIWWNNG